MSSLSKQIERYKRVQWTLGAALLMGTAVYACYDRKTAARIAAIEAQTEVRQRDLKANLGKTANLSEVAREVERLKREVADYSRKFPRQLDMGPFIKDLTQISQQLALSEWKYKPGAPKRGESFYELPIQMQFEGDFVNVASFLRQIEDMQRLTRVNKLSVKAKDSKAGVVEVDLTMNIYFSEG